MKIIILKGGLGNQLFQVAYACYLAKKKQQRIVLLTGLLGSYRAKRAFYFSDYFGHGNGNIQVKSSFALAYLIRVFAFMLEPLFPKSIFMESSKKYSREQNLQSAFIIDAYLQSFNDPEYFHFLLHEPSFAEFFKTSLKSYFDPWQQQVLTNTICLHIRGTDLKNLFNEAALKLAVKQLLDRLAAEHSTEPIIVVTDDVNFAQTLIEPAAKVSFQSENWQVDFLTLANARLMGLIDSTFSIWAGLYGLIVRQQGTMVASPLCIQKYPLLSYLHQQEKIKSLEDNQWK